MESKLKFEFDELPEKLQKILEGFYECFQEVLKGNQVDQQFHTLIQRIKEDSEHPFVFAPYHQRILTPFNYYQFGLDFFRPLVDFSRSSVSGQENLKTISGLLKKGGNVILLANHQSEVDPQVISIMLEKEFPKLAEEMIFVAGERVVTDPVAIPFSKGRNLLCIYSKRYIDHPPQDKEKKQQHNKRTMQLMSDLLKEGGKIIYVAPSGGRDRRNLQGNIEIAPLDPNSVEMFFLMAQKAGKNTHFYPLTLDTYALMPPPASIQIELGEQRIVKHAPVHLAFGAKIDMEHFPGYEGKDKHAKRQARADFIWNIIRTTYEKISS